MQAPPRRDRPPARGDARLLRLVEGRRPGLRDARALRRAGAHRRVGRATTTSCSRSSTAAAARSAAAADRPTGPCWRSRPGSVDGRFKLTEQGEVIFAQYGDQAIAARHIEQMAAATLLASAPVERGARTLGRRRRFRRPRRDAWTSASRARFFEPGASADGFAPWFAQVTPHGGDRAARARLAARRAAASRSSRSRTCGRSRGCSRGRRRASTSPAGSGSARRSPPSATSTLLRDAYARWPLFTSMIDNVEMSLAKTDERLAAPLPRARRPRRPRRRSCSTRWQLTREWVLRDHRAATSMLEGRPVLRRAVRLRSPTSTRSRCCSCGRCAASARSAESVDPDRRADHRLLLLTVNGIAAGLQNTG